MLEIEEDKIWITMEDKVVPLYQIEEFEASEGATDAIHCFIASETDKVCRIILRCNLC